MQCMAVKQKKNKNNNRPKITSILMKYLKGQKNETKQKKTFAHKENKIFSLSLSRKPFDVLSYIYVALEIHNYIRLMWYINFVLASFLFCLVFAPLCFHLVILMLHLFFQ